MKSILSLFSFLVPITLMAQFEVQQISNVSKVDNAYPAWSPDSKQLVFQSTRFNGSWDLFIMDADGSNLIQLTSDSHDNYMPSWSPDGNHIAFVGTKTGNQEIYLMNLQSKVITNLTKHPAQDLHPYWTQKGTSLLFTSYRDGSEDIFELDIHTLACAKMVDTDQSISCGVLSPNQHMLLFRNNDQEEIFVKDEHEQLINITNHPARDGWPAWSPDGQFIIFSSNRGYPQKNELLRYDHFNYDLYIMTANGGQLTQLTCSPGYQDARATWSPDGTKIAFTRAGSEYHSMDIHLMELSKVASPIIFDQRQYLNFVQEPCSISKASFYRMHKEVENRKDVFLTEDYFLNGQLKSQIKHFISSPKLNTGNATYWFENGQLSSTGHYSQNIKIGEWLYYHSNGQKAARRIYENGIILESQFWDTTGQLIVIVEEDAHKKALFPGEANALNTYLSNHLNYPKQARLDKVQGVVVVLALVNQNGEIIDTTIRKSLRKDLDEEALRIVQGMPKWEPAILHNRISSSIVGIPVHFRLSKQGNS